MKYEIAGGAFPIVTCHLENGESMITESGSMVWMTPNLRCRQAPAVLAKSFHACFPAKKSSKTSTPHAVTE